MKTFLCNIMFLVVVFSLLFFSCSPLPKSYNAPGIGRVEVNTNGNVVDLSAYLEHDTDLVSECGFMYGVDDDNMIKVVSSLKDGAFNARLYDISYSTKYQFYAYITNEKNLIRSDVFTFWTSAPPPEPEPEPEPEPGPQFNLPFDHLKLTAYKQDPYILSITGNVRYEVIVPEDVGWLWAEASELQKCKIFLRANSTESDRTCDIIFNSLDHDCQHILKVTQEHLDISVVTKSYQSTTFYLYVDSGFKIGEAITIDDNGNGDAENWISWIEYSDRIKVTLLDNTTNEVRQIKLIVFDSKQEKHLLFSIVQNPKPLT